MHTNTNTHTINANNTGTNPNVHTITNASISTNVHASHNTIINAHTTINPDTTTHTNTTTSPSPTTDIDTNTTTDTDTTNAHTHTYHHTNAQEHMTHTTGFTIVELLIVIVIIAILAAITIVAYSGIQQRAQNSAIISAAEQTYKLIEGYIGANDAYPLTSTTSIDACISIQSGCTDNVGNVIASSATLTNALKTIGNPPASIPSTGTLGNSIRYNYNSFRIASGKSQPAVIMYRLTGTNQQCKLPGVVAYSPDGTSVVPSTTGYTQVDTLGDNVKTLCFVTVPGPSA